MSKGRSVLGMAVGGNRAVGIYVGEGKNNAVARAAQRFLRMATDVGNLTSGDRRVTAFDVIMRGVRLYLDEQVGRHPGLKPIVDARLAAFEKEIQR